MSLPWSTVCLAGVWGFVACTVGLILQGFPARGVLARVVCTANVPRNAGDA